MANNRLIAILAILIVGTFVVVAGVIAFSFGDAPLSGLSFAFFCFAVIFVA